MVKSDTNDNRKKGEPREYAPGKFKYEKRVIAKNGTRKRLCVTGTSKSMCYKKMKEKEEQFELTSRLEASNKERFDVGFSDWLYNIKRNHKKVHDSAFTRYVSSFNTHILDSFLGRMPEHKIQPSDIVLFLETLEKHSSKGLLIGKPLSYSSIKKVYNLLNEYFRYKYIRCPELNPMLTVPAPVRESITTFDGSLEIENDFDEYLDTIPLYSVWNDEQMLMIHKVCISPYRPGIKGSVKRGPLIAFLLWTCLRSGELRALTWKDVHIEEGYLKVKKTWKRRKVNGNWETYLGTPKTKNGERTVELHKYAIEALEEYKRRFPPKNENDFICTNDDGGILVARSLNKTLESILKGLGYDKMPEKNKTVHGLRHSGISYYIRNKMPLSVVSQMAGHSSTSITERVYVEIIREFCKEEMDKLNKRI